MIQMNNLLNIKLEDLEKLRILGEGTYGKCYLVQNKITNQLCVLKQIEIFGMSMEEQQQVIRQAKILSVLNHPFVVKFLTFFKTQSYLNIVMQYADGGDLNKIIRQAKGNHFQQNQILNWFTQICLAIKHIHDRKVIHRDLKCQNIFMTKQGLIKLGDFGIAKHLSKTLQKIKTIVGTPYYMSPQICQNKDYSFKTDIWSLGVILYQMCALKLPFDGSSLPVLALKISKGQYPAITANYSKQLKSLIKNLLQNNPSKRPSINKILENPLIIKRIQIFLPKQVFTKDFINNSVINKNLPQKQNDQDVFQQSLNNKSQIEIEKKPEIQSARGHNRHQGKAPGLKNVQSSTRIKEAGLNSKSGKFQKQKKKKVESFKRREISQPNLALKKMQVKNNDITQIEYIRQQSENHEQYVQTIKQTLGIVIQQKFNDKVEVKYLQTADSFGFADESFCGNGLLSLLWAIQTFNIQS